MICNRCGKQNVPQALFCYNCGAPLVRDQASQPQVPTMENSPANPNSPKTGTDQAAQRPVAAAQEVPPPPQNQPPPTYSNQGQNWPGQPGNWNSPQSQPPYGNPYQNNPYGQRFGTPPQPPRVPLAPNGMPMPVFSNPEAFYTYTNKEGKKVYAGLATFGQRLLAVFIDSFIIYVVLGTILAVGMLATMNPDQLDAILNGGSVPDTRSVLPPWALLLTESFYLFYCALMLAFSKGQTLGKKIARIKVIRLDGSKLDFKTALLRSSFGFSWPLGQILAPYADIFGLLSLLLIMMVILGFGAAFFNKQRRGWHDKLAETIVVMRTELVQGINY
jgi:uncharacterized RDD family membrane protein YckC